LLESQAAQVIGPRVQRPRLGACVDRQVERHHRRQHGAISRREVTERTAVRAEQRECLRCRHGHRDRVEDAAAAPESV